MVEAGRSPTDGVQRQEQALANSADGTEQPIRAMGVDEAAPSEAQQIENARDNSRGAANGRRGVQKDRLNVRITTWAVE